jgi:peptidyl-prolyl cis-trans isomerase D
MMVKPFADMAWSLKLNEVSGVVESEFGFHIIKLTGIKPGATRSFESARAEIEQEVRRQEAGREFAKAAEQFTNLVYESTDGLKAAADRFKLSVKTQADVGRNGPIAAVAGDRSPLTNAKLLGELFSEDSVKTHRNTDAVEVAPNTLVSARIVEHTPAAHKPLEQVKYEISQRIVARESAALARQAGEALVKQLTDGGAQAGAQASGFGAAQAIKRSEAGQSKIAPPALERLFKLPTEKLPQYVGVDLGSQGYGVYELRGVTAATAEQIKAKREGYAGQFAQFAAQQEVAAYMNALKERSRVKKNLAAIAVREER